MCIRDSDDLGKKTKIKKKEKNVSFASRELALFGSGALLADACTHGIPNSFRGGAVEGWGEEFAGSCFLVGFLTFYALDCFIRSREQEQLDHHHHEHHHGREETEDGRRPSLLLLEGG